MPARFGPTCISSPGPRRPGCAFPTARSRSTSITTPPSSGRRRVWRDARPRSPGASPTGADGRRSPLHGAMTDAALAGTPSGPDPDVSITPELAQTLLRAQHPDLAALAIQPVADGWDNAVMRLGP